jgi:K+-sensing histidine kinase KdpD
MNSLSNEGVEYLVQIVQDLSLARDLNTITSIVRKAARTLTGADGASFVLRDNGQCYYADEDAISPLWKGLRFPMETCISGWSMINKQHVSIADIYADNRIPHEAYRPTFVKSLTMVPIRQEEPVGAIGAYWANHYIPTSRELKLLQSLADITAVAIENVNLYVDLENRVRIRTAELESAKESLEAYTHSISHDLKAPLRSIKALAEMLYERMGELDLKDGELTRITNRTLNRVNHMDALIAGLLDFARLGKQRLSCARVPVRKLAEEIGQELIDQHPERKINLSVCEYVPDAWGDALLIRQALQNLLSNAVKYTGKTEMARIEVGFEDQEAFIKYSIRDNGAGFNPKFAGKLFEVFHRLHSESEFEGIGIGLSLTRRIIHRHGGEIEAEANVNEGAVFRFTLPKPPVLSD